MFENFRERLNMMQQDFTTGFKTLGDKSRDTKIWRQFRLDENLPLHFGAGLEILSRYEESWFPLHKRSKDCAQTAEAVDGDIVLLSAQWERRRTAMKQLCEQLQCLPAFVSELDVISANIAHLEGDFEEMESRLIYLETLFCQCEERTFKQHHINKLGVYKKKRVDLNSQYAQKVTDLEQAIQQKLREQQKVYEEAFKEDMKQYLSTGYLHCREPLESNACVLDHMTVTNTSDQEALDDFLNSADNGSSLMTDLGPCCYKSCQMDQTPPTNNQLCNCDAVLDQAENAVSEESDELLILSNEEDIQPLTDVEDIGIDGVSGECDSTGSLPCKQPSKLVN